MKYLIFLILFSINLFAISTNISEITQDINSKDWIINKFFQISQRGDYSSTETVMINNTYYVDRWAAYISGGETGNSNFQVISTDQPLAGSRSIRIIAKGLTNNAGFYQKLNDYNYFSNKNVTASGWFKSNNTNCGFSIQDNSNSSSISFNTNNIWEYKKVIHKVSSSISSLYPIITTMRNSSVNSYCEFTGITLNLGTKPIPIVAKSYVEDLNDSLFYAEKSFDLNTAPANGANATTFSTSTGRASLIDIFSTALSGAAAITVNFKTPKRTNTYDVYFFGNNTNQWKTVSLGNNNVSWQSMTVNLKSQNSMEIYANFGINGFATMYQGHWFVDAEIY